ncbi:MAG: glutaminase domain-containing protein [Thermoguttaceae bacterium]
MKRTPLWTGLAWCGALFVLFSAATAVWPQQKPAVAGSKKGSPKAGVPKERPRPEGRKRGGRDREQIVAACQLRPGMIVADIGAGTGPYTRLFAPKVAPGGKVLALEIKKNLVDQIDQSCRQQNLTNVLALLSTPQSTGLPPNSIDLAFLCNTYHHFEYPREMLASIRSALRPDGRLVIVDFHKQGNMKDHVRAGMDLVIEEARAAGLELFDHRDLSPQTYLLRFKKGATRVPAVPLVVHDPYFSIWSFADRLADDWPRHWTGTPHGLCGMVRIDGAPLRIMGAEPRELPAMEQTGLEIFPTRTIYQFEDRGVHLRLTFLTPILPYELERVGRPVSYLVWEVSSLDGRPHKVELYYDNSAELVVDKASQPVVWSRPKIDGLAVMQIGSQEQPVLEKKGDNLRIDWGYLYVAAPTAERPSMAISDHRSARAGFATTGRLPEADDRRMPRPADRDWPVTACMFDLGEVGSQKVSCWLMLAYDDLYSIEYLGTRLRPYWRRQGAEAAELLQTAAKEYLELSRRCERFDEELLADLQRIAGPAYAQLGSLAYRQAMGGHKLVAGPDGQPMLFPKENFSNGCIGTVDVIYPAAPIFMLFRSDLLKATLRPVFEYAMTPRWRFPFAPHDLGIYPKANGQVYGGGEKSEENQMPVEESGNMLILAAAVCQIDGNTQYVQRYWPLLERWAEYLMEKGLDPENQLCTDDFAGHLAHNANLSLKAILALGAFAKTCDMAGRKKQAARFRQAAAEFARQWPKLADDGDHYRLAFDRPGTWSQKYNLVWDKLLGLKLFPPEIARKEVAFYKTRLNRFGLPLDSRQSYTKTDWTVWTATLAESRADFDALMVPVYRFLHETPDRVPLTDWYMTDDARLRGFRARPVIGGVFLKMLDDSAMWKKWSSKRQ